MGIFFIWGIDDFILTAIVEVEIAGGTLVITNQDGVLI
jgi:hypothetical protein